MPRQIILKEKDAPDSSHQKAILPDIPSPNDIHPKSPVTTELSRDDKEYASLERTFTDIVLTKHECSGKNQIALTNKQYEAIKEYLDTTRQTTRWPKQSIACVLGMCEVITYLALQSFRKNPKNCRIISGHPIKCQIIMGQC